MFDRAIQKINNVNVFLKHGVYCSGQLLSVGMNIV